MIETTKSYKVGDKIYATITEAQRAALAELLCPNSTPTDVETNLILNVVGSAESVIEILLLYKERQGMRKPRSDRGKKHKPSGVPDEPVPMGGVKVEGSGKYSGK